MEPFSLALGISGEELAPWREALFTTKDSVVLVEGDIDKEYLELLRSDEHGDNRFKFEGVIFPYGGKDTLRQKQLLRFIKSRFKKFIVTYDLDVEAEVEPHLKDMELSRGVEYMPIGKDIAGKKCIEGLLPESVFQSVYAANVDLIQKVTGGNTGEARSAKSSLKKLCLGEFKRAVKPQTEGYKSFYQLAKQLSRMTQERAVS
jgi:hypothetical protein